MSLGQEGILSFAVLPVYAGAVDYLGVEPISSSLYRRGMIRWDRMPNDELIGSARIDVPAGMWHWVIYAFHPTSPQFYAVEKMPTITTTSSGQINLDCIIPGNIVPNASPIGALPD